MFSRLVFSKKYCRLFLLLTLFVGACSEKELEITVNSSFLKQRPLIPSLYLGSISATENRPLGFHHLGQSIRVGAKLVAADSGNHRVLIWNNWDANNSVALPDVVLGQPERGTHLKNYGGIGEKSLSSPVGLASDGTRLFVSDSGNNRILVWNQIPTTHFKEANLALGQSDFTSSGAALTATGLSNPWSLYYYNNNLYVSDQGNGRVMVWNTSALAMGATASLVLGQTNFTSKSTTASSSIFLGPDGIWTDGNKLVVSDYSGHRVLLWNSLPSSNGAAAELVLGQSLMTDVGPNQGGLSASSLSSPAGIASDGVKLFVADNQNHRILVWNTWPNSDNQAADAVIGQANFSSNIENQAAPAASLQGLASPLYPRLEGSHLLVSDSSNFRLMGFDAAAVANNMSALYQFGQAAFDERIFQRSLGGSDSLFFRQAHRIYLDSESGKLFVSDCANNRVLIWNALPANSNVEPNIVIGQTDFSETFVNSGGVSAQSLSCPMGIAILNGKLAIADSGNNRILIFNSIPTSHFPSADLVLGQTAATMNAANQGGRSASSLNGPQGVAFTPLGLLVADSGNHRVLIYNAVPLSSPGTADLVLGQSNFSNAVLNSGGLSAATLAQPTQVLWIETLQKLLVVDPVNSRVLVWSGIPTVNKQNANNVIGQSSMTQIEDGPSATLLSEPADLNWSTDGLMISDKKNHRLLLWQELPSANGVPANFVFGQNSMELNQHGIGSSTYSTPTSYGQYGTKCVLLDSDNHRVLIYDKETFFASRVGNDNE